MKLELLRMARRIDALKTKNEALKSEVAVLRRRVEFFERCPSLQNGFMGEELISGIVNGKLTVHTAPHDIELKDGRKIEVKFSNLNRPNKASESTRWSWNYPTGLRQGKVYNSLLLIGVADPRFQELYLDSDCPYVIFDIPKRHVKRFNQRGNHISITTDPSRAGDGTRSILFSEFQTTMKQLKKKYGFKTRQKTVET